MKIVVFDDDPTGSQTVHGCQLLLCCDKESIINGIRDASPLLFLLTNTRSMSAHIAADKTREICQSLMQALKSERISIEDVLFVSRGDSTLRGHGVIEPAVINQMLGPFDATFHVPAFFEGGRTTVESVHLLNGIPVHTTPFAKDKIFGYSNSDLTLWLEEKSDGSICADNVARLKLPLLDAALGSEAGMKRLINWLLKLSHNRAVVVDAEIPAQLDILAKAIRSLIHKKRFLFRSAASFINCLASIPTNHYVKSELISLRLRTQSGDQKPGLVIVGSHVPLADEQLECLLQHGECVGLELSVKEFARALEEEFSDIKLSALQNDYWNQLNNFLSSDKTPVLYTSRGELEFTSAQERISFSNSLADFVARLVARVAPELGYVISKGGITTHSFLEKGLELDSVKLKGQLIPGLSMVCAEKYCLAKDLPVITFPGNFGQRDTLLYAWRLMESLK